MELSDLEKIAIELFPDEGNDISVEVAKTIADKIRENNLKGDKTVLGLATGTTFLDVYRELIRMHNEEGLDFSRVVAFNLDEFYGIKPDDINSYNRYIRENFLDHIDINEKNIHTLNGRVRRDKIPEYCEKYEKAIRDAGGIDIQLVGIGRNGHMGLNEAGSRRDSRTRLVDIDEITMIDLLPGFGEDWYVPTEAITMGVGTILEAKQVILMSRGENKAIPIKYVVYE